MSGGAIYFLVFGPLAAGMGVALLLDVKGLGRRWEDEVNRSSAHVGRVFGWPPNRYIGPTWRPFAGVLFLLLGAATVILVVAGAIR
jgi:hypothetical protein